MKILPITTSNFNQKANKQQTNPTFGIGEKAAIKFSLGIGAGAIGAALKKSIPMQSNTDFVTPQGQVCSNPVSSGVVTSGNIPTRKEFEAMLEADCNRRENETEKYKDNFLKCYDIDPDTTIKIYNLTREDGVLMRDTLKDGNYLGLLLNDKAFNDDILSSHMFLRKPYNKYTRDCNEKIYEILKTLSNLKGSSDSYIVEDLDIAINLANYSGGYYKGLITMLKLKENGKLRFPKMSSYYGDDLRSRCDYYRAVASEFFEKEPEKAKKYALAKNSKNKYRISSYDICRIATASYGYNRNNSYYVMWAYPGEILKPWALDIMLGLTRKDGTYIHDEGLPSVDSYDVYAKYPEEYIEYYSEISPETGEYLHNPSESINLEQELALMKQRKNTKS